MHVRFGSSVGAIAVFSAVTSVVEALGALRAGVGLLSSVCPQMGLEILHPRVGLVTALILRER